MSMIHVSEIHFTSKPVCAERLSKEARTYDFLDDLQIAYEGVDHDITNTIADCHAIDAALSTHVCKNLFLRNRQKTDFYLLMMPGDKVFVTKELSHQLGVSRLSFAEPEFLEKFLDLTPGSVSVLGLMNDTAHHVKLLIDEDLLKDESLGCHPCINTSSLKVRVQDILQKFLPATGHTYTVVKL